MIEVIFEEEKQRAAAYDNKRFIGEATFSIGSNQSIWILDHTRVDDAYRGQGIASRLVAQVVAEARKAAVKIAPLCKYALYEFERKSEYADIRA